MKFEQLRADALFPALISGWFLLFVVNLGVGIQSKWILVAIGIALLPIPLYFFLRSPYALLLRTEMKCPFSISIPSYFIMYLLLFQVFKVLNPKAFENLPVTILFAIPVLVFPIFHLMKKKIKIVMFFIKITPEVYVDVYSWKPHSREDIDKYGVITRIRKELEVEDVLYASFRHPEKKTKPYIFDIDIQENGINVKCYSLGGKFLWEGFYKGDRLTQERVEEFLVGLKKFS